MKSAKHLSDRLLVDLAEDTLSFDQLTASLLHLARCDRCRKRLQQLRPEQSAAPFRKWLQHSKPRVAPTVSDLEPTDTQSGHRRREAVREVRDAEALWNEVSAMDPRQRRILILNSPRFRRLAFPVLMVETAGQFWRHDPHQALDLSDMAVKLLDELKSASTGRSGQIHRHQARALTYRANCLRILGRLVEAALDFRRAHLETRGREEVAYEQGLVLQFQSTLRRDQRDYLGARQAIRSALQIFRNLGDHQRVIELTLKDCLVLREAGKPELGISAIRDLQDGYKLTELGLGNIQSIHHNAALLLTDLGQTSKALMELERAKILTRETHAKRFDVMRLKWVEALLLDGAGKLEEAEELYFPVQRFFLDEGIGHDAAGVSLELALLYLRWGRYEKARQLVREITPIFLSHHLQPEAMASQLVSWQALLRQIRLTPTR